MLLRRRSWLMLTGGALTCSLCLASVQGTQGTSAAASAAVPDSAVTSAQVLSLLNAIPSTTVLGSYADTLNYIGMNLFPDIYAGDDVSPNGSITVYVANPDYSVFQADLSVIPLQDLSGDLTNAPTLSFDVVPESYAALFSASQAVSQNEVSADSSGFTVSQWGPDPATGQLNVWLSSAPIDATTASVTSWFQQNVSPLAEVVSLASAPLQTYDDRGSDSTPWTAGDRVSSAETSLCTTGFSVLNTGGDSRALTAAHCGDGTFTNGGNTLGSTLEWYLSTGSCTVPNCFDISTLKPNGAFNPYVWIGTPGEGEPTRDSIGGNFIDFPADGEEFTFSGGNTGTVRDNKVINAAPDFCGTFDTGYGAATVCNIVQFPNSNVDGVTNAAPGDSGGPVFCIGCYSVDSPESLIEGGNSSVSDTTFLQSDLNKTGTTIYETP